RQIGPFDGVRRELDFLENSSDSLLGYLDSNQEQLNQNQPCCQLHHTPRAKPEPRTEVQAYPSGAQMANRAGPPGRGAPRFRAPPQMSPVIAGAPAQRSAELVGQRPQSPQGLVLA